MVTKPAEGTQRHVSAKSKAQADVRFRDKPAPWARTGLLQCLDLPQRVEKFVAGYLATSASLCTQAAVLVHLGVFFTLLGAGPACL